MRTSARQEDPRRAARAGACGDPPGTSGFVGYIMRRPDALEQKPLRQQLAATVGQLPSTPDGHIPDSSFAFVVRADS
ncbi:hypothetical protein AB0C96_37435 [Streptomyces sp. NPDC048506]|uniref:hypothetical protein n=1 Tax=Streptomyces sp. NPDC048506 TaxID=3155028 RepID=UPI003412B7B4